MSFLTHFLRDVEQIVFPKREQNAIPSMDGALSPNDRLDSCHVIGTDIVGADDVVEAADGSLYVSGGSQVLRLSGDGYSERSVFATFDDDAGGLAVHPDGRLLVCVSGRGLAAVDPSGKQNWLTQAEDVVLNCLTSVTATPDGHIFLTNGSSKTAPKDWLTDLMQKNRQGSLISCGPGLDRPTVLSRGLAYPHGLAVMPDGKQLWMTEGWSHRLSHAAARGQEIGKLTAVNVNLVGYPARLTPSSDGGFWLCLFALRTHLVEFVLREDDFRNEMMRTIEPQHWVGPALASGHDCLEPMQWGSIRALGIQKPWAPPRSYGLIVRINKDGDVSESLHSRAGGQHHGITAVRETSQGLVIVSKGSGRVLLDRSGGRA
jgi:hypothetical protein